MQTILVPFDGSKHALKALHIAGDLAEKYKCEICLISIIAKTLKDLQDARQKTQKLIALAKSKLNTRGLEPASMDIEVGEPAECILLAAKRHKVSTIVMGCRGETMQGDSQFGSVSQKVFQMANCTCISVK